MYDTPMGKIWIAPKMGKLVPLVPWVIDLRVSYKGGGSVIENNTFSASGMMVKFSSAVKDLLACIDVFICN